MKYSYPLLTLLVQFAIAAETPDRISFQAYMTKGGVPVGGDVSLTVSWYGQPVGGVAVLVEPHFASFKSGFSTLLLGAHAGLPDSLLLSGTAWIGLTIDGEQEMVPRTMLTSVPFARVASYSQIAGSLHPNVTGVVTSLNEVAGNVRIVADTGLSIRREGNLLRLGISGSDFQSAYSGIVIPAEMGYRFPVDVGVPITDRTVILAMVLSGDHTTIGCSVRVLNRDEGKIEIVTGALITPESRIHWLVNSDK